MLHHSVTDDRIQEKLAKLVLDRCNGFALKARFVACIFLRPKGPDERVFDLPDDPGAIPFVGEHSVDSQKRCVGTLQ